MSNKMMSIHNVKVYGLEKSIKRSGYPMMLEMDTSEINAKDLDRASRLGRVESGSGHDNYLKGIIVQFDINYSGYWTPQAQRYHWFDIISSSSKMHRITSMNIGESVNKYVDLEIVNILTKWIERYNMFPKKCDFSSDVLIIEGNVYTLENEIPVLLINNDRYTKYEVYMKIISNCPMGLMQFEAVTTNYLQLKTIYHQRRNHKLKEDWGYFCDWIEQLPKFKELVLTNK